MAFDYGERELSQTHIPNKPQPNKAGRASPMFLQTEKGMVSCFKREGDIIKKAIRKIKYLIMLVGV